jgi:hypothetical protein
VLGQSFMLFSGVGGQDGPSHGMDGEYSPILVFVNGPVAQLDMSGDLLNRRSEVRVFPGPPELEGWPRGLWRRFAKPLYRKVSQVRILSLPPIMRA